MKGQRMKWEKEEKKKEKRRVDGRKCFLNNEIKRV